MSAKVQVETYISIAVLKVLVFFFPPFLWSFLNRRRRTKNPLNRNRLFVLFCRTCDFRISSSVSPIECRISGQKTVRERDGVFKSKDAISICTKQISVACSRL